MKKHEKRGSHRWLGRLEIHVSFSRNCLEDLGVFGRIILKWIFKNRMGGCGLNLFGSGYGPAVSAVER
jgi:hypothetical protein